MGWDGKSLTKSSYPGGGETHSQKRDTRRCETNAVDAISMCEIRYARDVSERLYGRGSD